MNTDAITRAECAVHRSGPVAYGDALAQQEEWVAQRQRGEGADHLWLLEHPRVITLGRNAHEENLLLSAQQLADRGFETFEVGRGGDVTYHGPGQLVGYPILKLEDDERDAHAYLRTLEEVLIRTLADFGIAGHRKPPHTGVWVNHEDRWQKIAAIGVRLSRWVSSHGFALNVNCDLDDFGVIVPCGIRDFSVTSLSALLGREVAVQAVMDRVVAHFGEISGRRLVQPSSAEAFVPAARIAIKEPD